MITRDIHRTFPAHDYFKDSDGDGQDSLYKICKVGLGSAFTFVGSGQCEFRRIRKSGSTVGIQDKSQ